MCWAVYIGSGVTDAEPLYVLHEYYNGQMGKLKTGLLASIGLVLGVVTLRKIRRRRAPAEEDIVADGGQSSSP